MIRKNIYVKWPAIWLSLLLITCSKGETGRSSGPTAPVNTPVLSESPSSTESPAIPAPSRLVVDPLADTWNTQGFRLYQKGEYEAAAEKFRKAIFQDSTYLLPHYNLACMLSLLDSQGQSISREEIFDELAICLGLDATVLNLEQEWVLKRMKEDSDLAPLRQEEQFQNLLQKTSPKELLKESDQLPEAVTAGDLTLTASLLTRRKLSEDRNYRIELINNGVKTGKPALLRLLLGYLGMKITPFEINYGSEPMNRVYEEYVEQRNEAALIQAERNSRFSGQWYKELLENKISASTEGHDPPMGWGSASTISYMGSRGPYIALLFTHFVSAAPGTSYAIAVYSMYSEEPVYSFDFGLFFYGEIENEEGIIAKIMTAEPQWLPQVEEYILHLTNKTPPLKSLPYTAGGRRIEVKTASREMEDMMEVGAVELTILDRGEILYQNLFSMTYSLTPIGYFLSEIKEEGFSGLFLFFTGTAYGFEAETDRFALVKGLVLNEGR